MNVAALLEELRRRDIHVYADGEDLRCDAPAGALSAEMRENLRERKREILEFLRAPAQLSSSQKRLWFLNELAPGSAAYLIADAFELRGELDVPRLERVLQAILRRHESMRTVFVSVDGQPRQHAVEAGAWRLPVVDLSAEPEHARRLRQELRDESCRAFDLTSELPFRARLYRLAADQHALLLSMHHIVSDGWSLSVLARELAELYASMGRGDTASLPPLRLQYRDCARWQSGRLQGDFLGGLLAHWRARLAGAPQVLELPTDRPRPQGENYPGADHTIGLSRELADGLRGLGRAAGATLFMVLFAGFSVVLARYSGQREYLVGTPVANRSRPEFENQVGFFVNTLVLRADLKGEPTTMELLGRVREVCLDAYAHQEMPFELLVEAMRPERDLSRNPLFQVMFALQNTPPKPSKMGEVAMRALNVERTAAQFDLSLDVHETADGLKAVFNYNTDLFDEATVARMANHWRLILEAMRASPERSVWKLPMLTDEELAQATSAAGAAAEAAPASLPLHEMFEAQVARSPAAPAVVSGGITLTYRELEQRANQLAHALRKRGVARDVLVGLCVSRSPDMVAGLLGILKAGGAYVPLDPGYPAQRLALMLEDCKPRVIVTERGLRASLPSLPESVEVVYLDDEDATLAVESMPPKVEVAASDLAYAIYTSGSTGRPKAALLTHRGLSNLAASEYRLFGIDAHSRVLHFASLSFDTSLSEITLALCSGAALYVEPRERLPLGPDVERYVEREKITVLSFTPSALAMLDPAACRSIEQVIVGGEPCPLELAQRWAGRCRFFNTYGPTETSVTTTYVEYRDGALPPLIGRPLPSVRVYLLDEALQPVPVGAAGEMYIGGVGVARGYLNRPELSAERFVPDPFSGAPAATMYRSGDFARRRMDGQIEFIGRRDAQVKVRGFRIELGEIETALKRHPSVKGAAVVVREDAPGDRRLVAYVIPDGAAEGLTAALRNFLAHGLPAYMLPSAFVPIDAFPLTPNDKLDVKALPAPDASAAVGPSYVGPRTATEKAIAEIWSAVLGVKQVGVHDHFFELGGDSILSIQIIARCRQAGLQLTPRDLFRRPTVAQLAEACAQAPTQAAVAQETLAGTVQLTPIQRWFVEEDLAERHHWNQAFLFELPAETDLAALERALRQVMRHHDALRLRLRSNGTDWVQEYASDSDFPPVERIDLAGIDPRWRAAAIEEHAARIQSSLDLAQGPLLRAAYFALGAGERGRLLLVIHHLAVDGVSWRLILEDLESAYSSLQTGASPALPPKTTSYQAWAERLVEFARSETPRRSLPFWISESNKPVSALPAAPSDCQNLERDARVLKNRLTVDETRALLQQVPGAYRTQVNDVLLTALTRALQQWTGGEAFRIELEGHGREELFDDVDVSRTVGWFTSVFPVRLELPAGLDEASALKSVKEQLRRIPDRGMSYGLLRYASGDSEARAALSQPAPAALLFNYLGQFDQVVAGSRLFGFAAEPSGPWHSPGARRSHQLEVLCLVRGGALEVEWVYHPGIHAAETIERVAQHFLGALRVIIGHCVGAGAGGRTPSDFPLAVVSQDALDDLWQRFPGLEDVYPLSPMQRLFHLMESSSADHGAEPWHFRLDGKVDTARLRTAVERVVQRHPILRTAFVSRGGAEPLQVVLRQVRVPWSEEDWRGLPPAEQDARLEAYRQADKRARFDLVQPPLMRLALRRSGEETWHLLFSTHHLQVDGWSWPLIFREISMIYEALSRGSEAQLDPACAYRSYVAWLQGKAPDSEAFWKRALSGFAIPTPINLAAAPAASEPRAGDVEEALATLDRDATAALQALARTQRVTLSTIVQGAWALLLAHYGATRDVVFGAAFSGRPAEVPGIEWLVGPCVNNLPVRVSVTPEESLPAWLAQLQSRQFELAEYQFTPLEKIQACSQVPWRYRLFDSLIVFQNYQVDEAARRLGSDASLVPLATPEATHYQLTVMAIPLAELHLRLIYQRDRMAQDVVRTYAADLVSMLRAIAAKPEQKLSALLAQLSPSSKGKAAEAADTKARAAMPAGIAPRNDLEVSLATVWERVLGVKVGITDNFFELGGNSLGVLKLIGEMRAATGVEIDLGEVFRSPTIAQLVTSLGPDAKKNASVVVPLQPEGSGLPVFCICGLNIYRDFAHSLGKEQPVFGVYVQEEQAIVDQVIKGQKPQVSVERLVDAYYKAIARFQPEGPYRLAGLSFGGILAMELAAKMRKRGAEVDVVFLLDAALPQGLRRNWSKWLSYQATEIIKGNGAIKLRRLLARLRNGIGNHHSRSLPGERVSYVDEAFAVRQGQEAAFMAAAQKWSKSGSAYDFRAILFRASDSTMWGAYTDLDEDYGWRRYLGDNLHIVDAIGGHRGIIEPPNVAELGRKARRYLTQADRGDAPT